MMNKRADRIGLGLMVSAVASLWALPQIPNPYAFATALCAMICFAIAGEKHGG